MGHLLERTIDVPFKYFRSKQNKSRWCLKKEISPHRVFFPPKPQLNYSFNLFQNGPFNSQSGIFLSAPMR